MSMVVNKGASFALAAKLWSWCYGHFSGLLLLLSLLIALGDP